MWLNPRRHPGDNRKKLSGKKKKSNNSNNVKRENIHEQGSFRMTKRNRGEWHQMSMSERASERETSMREDFSVFRG